MNDNVVPGPWTDTTLQEEEVRRIISAFLTNPNREGNGATEEEILKVVTWARDLKLDAAININILRMIYYGQMALDLNSEGNVVMSLIERDVSLFPPGDEETESWLDV